MLPEGVKSGEPARLIPVVADTSKEERVASVALAMLTHIPELAQRLLATAGLRIGKRTRIEAYTEVVFSGEGTTKDRPDGLVVVSTGRNTWQALIEAKIGNASLDSEQVTRYAQIARQQGIDAVITLSNEFTARADHHPTTTLPKALSRKVALYHWPWMWVRTQAELIELEKAVDDVEQKFLLNEFIRFLTHPSTGIDKFKQMPKEWKGVVSTIRDGGSLKKGAPEVEAVVSAWQQEVRDIALDMSRYVGRKVEVKLSRKHQESGAEWLKDGCSELAENRTLSCALHVPDAANDMNIVADVALRTITCSLRLAAPKDRKSTKARVNWLVRQLKESKGEELQIRAIRSGKAHNNMKPVAVLRENPQSLEISNPDIVPTAFEVVLTRDLAGRFAMSQKFIEELEAAVPAFYDAAMQYLKAWQAPPPKPVAQKAEDASQENDRLKEEVL